MRTSGFLLAVFMAVAAVGQQPNCATAPALLVAPADNAIATSPVTFSWSAASGATKYRVWIIVDGGETAVLDATTGTTATDAVPSGAIEWYVEALFANCPSTFSAHRHFTVNSAATCGARQAPVLMSPAAGVSIASPVTFSWSATPGALLYRLWISVDGSQFVDVDETKQTTLSEDVPEGKVQWFVDAVTESCPSLSSAKAAFVVVSTSACASAAPFPITPADGSSSVSSPVTFTWTAVPNAIEYRILASVDGGDFFLLARSADTSETRFLPPGAWVWLVEAVFDSCPNTKSSRSRFTILRAATCPSTGPQLVAPANNATNVPSPVTFTWNAVTGAIGYALFAKANDGPQTFLTETTATQFQKRLPDATFEWWVIALFANCPPVESVHNTFAITTACDNRRPVNVVPHDGATGLTSPVQFVWSRTPNAKSYNLFVASGNNTPVLAGTTTDNKFTAPVTPGAVHWFVEANFDTCPTLESAASAFVARTAPACGTPQKPLLRVPGRAASASTYVVRWTAVPNASSYEVFESASLDFSTAASIVVSDVLAPFTHTVARATRYYYAVRAISNCNDTHSAVSRIASTVVIPQARATSIDIDAASGPAQTITLPPRTPATTFAAKADKPWVTVTPATGSIGAGGATLTVTTDRSALRNGTNAATVTVTYGSSFAKGRIAPNDSPPASSVPISVTIATPVSSNGKNTPLPTSLIIPAVAHATGLNASSYASDLRIANVSAAVMHYQLNFTLSRTDGTQSGQSTTIDVDPGATLALDDVLNSFFGLGPDGGNATGMVEIRPLSSSSSSTASAPNVTIASSRTFSTSGSGTAGEFIPAIPYSTFVANTAPATLVSLQHLTQNTAYHTNLGLVEGAGESASVLIHVYDTTGVQLLQVPLALLPGEHRQLTSFLQQYAITANDARIEIEVTSTTGKVSAYASVVDNVTNDPYLVPAVVRGGASSSRYVLPDVEANGASGTRSDVKLFNSGSSTVNATLVFSPQPGMQGSASSVPIAIPAGQVKSLDDVLRTSFNVTTSAGALLVTTPASSNLIVTGRTYTPSSGGTFGQFHLASTSLQGIAVSDAPLQLLQLEDSDQYKTSIGIAETSGKAATVEVSVVPPDAKAIPKVQIPLSAGGTQLINLSSFGLGNVYDARVTVKVISGTGRVTAYGSLVDLQTLDPTFVPAQ